MNYLIYRANQQEGPYPAEVIRERLGRGELAPGDLCFGEGMGDWTPISSVPELAGADRPAMTAPSAPVEIAPPPLASSFAPAAPSSTPRESWWTALMEKLSVTARLTQKQAHRKKLELSDLRNADHQIGKKAYEGGGAPAACAGLVAQIAEIRRQIATIEAETPEPANTFAEKAKGTAAAAARMAKLKTLHARDGLLLTELGEKIRLTVPAPPALATEIGTANRVAAKLAGLDAEITALSSQTYSWARQPLWALVAILLLAGAAAAYHWMHRGGPAVAAYTVVPPPVAAYEAAPPAPPAAYVYPPGHKWIVDEQTDRAVEHGAATPEQMQRYVNAQEQLAATKQAAVQQKMKEMQDAQQQQAEQQQAATQAAQAKAAADLAWHTAHHYDWDTDAQKKTLPAEMAQLKAWLAAHPQGATGAAGASSFPASVDISATALGPAPEVQSDQGFFKESPDFQRTFVTANQGTDQVAYVDGHPQKAYSKIVWNFHVTDAGELLVDSPSFSPDSKAVAYIAQLADNHLVAVTDGVEGPPFDSFEVFKYGGKGHSLVYVGDRGGKSYLYVNGQEIASEPVDSDSAIRPKISPDGQDVAYIRARRYIERNSWVKQAVLVLNGKPGPTFLDISDFRFSGDSQHTAYIAHGPEPIGTPSFNRHISVVIDSKVTSLPGAVEVLKLSDTGGHYALVNHYASNGDYGFGNENDVVSVIWDGKEFGHYNHVIVDQLALSSDGSRMAFIAPTKFNGDRHSMMVVDNGHPGKAYDRCDEMLLSPDGSKLLYKATANDQIFVVCNGKEFGPYFKGEGTSVYASFSPDSAHFAYSVHVPNSYTPQLYVDGQPATEPAPQWALLDTERTNGTPTKTYIPSSRLKLVDLSDNKGSRVALDGHAGPPFARIFDMLLGPDGKHVAYLASGPGQGQMVVVDGSVSPEFTSIYQVGPPSRLCTTHLAFSPDGSLQFVGQQKNILYRCTIPAASIAALPTLPQLDAGGDGWRPMAFSSSTGCPLPETSFVLDDGRIYGYTHEGAALVRAESDGSNVTLLRTFHQTNADLAQPGGEPVLSPSGDLYGCCTGGGANQLGGIYRIDGKTGTYSIIHSFQPVDYPPSGGKFTLGGVGLEGYPAASLVVIKKADNEGPSYIVHIKVDGSDVTTVTEPKPIDLGAGGGEVGVDPGGVNGYFGAFYRASDAWNAFAIVRYSTLVAGSMPIHTFAGAPDDCDESRNVIAAPDGRIYGLGSPSYLFSMNRDGSDYKILNKNVGTGQDSQLHWTNGMLYTVTGRGIVQLSPTDGQMTVMTPITRNIWGAHDDVLYAQDNSISGGSFRFILPHSGSVTPPALNLKMTQAGP